tara:strand:- start:370 stop:540 length:171 start_codon:yes stop_codon:yes gene_type:complete
MNAKPMIASKRMIGKIIIRRALPKKLLGRYFFSLKFFIIFYTFGDYNIIYKYGYKL